MKSKKLFPFVENARKHESVPIHLQYSFFFQFIPRAPIRGGTDDNSKIIFLFSQCKHTL